MITRVTFQLEGDEAEAFEELCNTELRSPGQMANYLVIQELREKNLLSKVRATRKAREEKEAVKLREGKKEKEVKELEKEVLRLKADGESLSRANQDLARELQKVPQNYLRNLEMLEKQFKAELYSLSDQFNQIREEHGMGKEDYAQPILGRLGVKDSRRNGDS